MKLLRSKTIWLFVFAVSFAILFLFLFVGNIQIPTFIKLTNNFSERVHLKVPPSNGRVYTLLIGYPSMPKNITGRGIAVFSNKDTRKQIDFDLSKCAFDRNSLSRYHLIGLVTNTSTLGKQITIDSQFNNKDVTTIDLVFDQTPPPNLSLWLCFITKIKYLPMFSKE